MTESHSPESRSPAAQVPDRSTLKALLIGVALIAAAILIPCGAHTM